MVYAVAAVVTTASLLRVDMDIFLSVPAAPEATTALSALVPDCNPARARVLAAVVVMVVGCTSAPPNWILLAVSVSPLSAVVLSGVVGMTTAVEATPLTVVVNSLVVLLNALDTVLTAGAVAATPFTVEVIVLVGLVKVLVVRPAIKVLSAVVSTATVIAVKVALVPPVTVIKEPAVVVFCVMAKGLAVVPAPVNGAEATIDTFPAKKDLSAVVSTATVIAVKVAPIPPVTVVKVPAVVFFPVMKPLAIALEMNVFKAVVSTLYPAVLRSAAVGVPVVVNNVPADKLPVGIEIGLAVVPFPVKGAATADAVFPERNDFNAVVSMPTVIAVNVAPVPLVMVTRLFAAVVFNAVEEENNLTHLDPSL